MSIVTDNVTEERYDTELKSEHIERLALLSEELGEAQQIIGKILRHGFYSFSPFDPEETSNRRLMEKEIGDIMCAVEILCSSGDIDRHAIANDKDKKMTKVWKYLHFNTINKADPFKAAVESKP